MLIFSFFLFLALFGLVGVLSVLKAGHNTKDYLVASRSIPPWLAGLSAVATNNSGFMFIGMIGLTYEIGLCSVWLMVGWILGDLLVSLYTLKPMLNAAAKTDTRSLGSLVARWSHSYYSKAGKLAGILTVVFLSGYAAAQFKAGGKALEALFLWPSFTGILLGAVLVLIYCFSGGIRASIWTDAAQSFVMLGGMGLLLYYGWSEYGHLVETRQLPDGYFSLFPQMSPFGVVLFIVGWLFGGMAIIGQPHIISRFLSMRSADDLPRMRMYYYGWFTVFYAVTIGVGLLSRLLIPATEGFDPEQALPLLSQELLPTFGVGLILAAIFAATMSTADSLILACTAAINEEFTPKQGESIVRTKTTTVLILLAAVAVALSDNQSIFDLVLMAWGLLAAAFAPLVILRSHGRQFEESDVLITLLGGVGIFLFWKYTGLGTHIYEVAPAIIGGTILGWVLSSRRRSSENASTLGLWFDRNMLQYIQGEKLNSLMPWKGKVVDSDEAESSGSLEQKEENTGTI